jgi:LysM repeat protein
MSVKLGAAIFGSILVLVAAQGCVFGGDDGGGDGGAIARPGSIVTATMPATLTDPILLGQSQTTGGNTGGTGTTGGASGQTYTVKSGDTLAGIAISLGVPQDQQAAWNAEVLRLNNIADARLLAVGVELVLPRIATPTGTPRPAGTPGTPAATPNRTTTPGTTPASGTTPQATTQAATSTPTVRPTTTGQSSGRTYTVVSGDTPLVIAGKLGIPAAQQASWANELVALNGINPSAMQIGDVLDLPVGTP